MIRHTLILLVLLGASVAFAEEVTPVWELGKSPIDPALTTGTIKLVAGVVTVDGENTFALPASVLGAQSSYTIEFEVKRPAGAKNGRSISLCSNSDKKNKTGLALVYYPPTYNTLDLHTNGVFTAHLQERKSLDDSFTKVTLLVQGKELLFFKDGLLLTATDTVHPSVLPLTFGGKVHSRFVPQPYQLRNLKVYNCPVFPAGFDKSTEFMHTVSGDQYTMHRAKITNPALPRILVVGDSISIAYRKFITAHFKGKAYVDYWVGGRWYEPISLKGKDVKVKRAYKGVLANGPYDVVSWNPMTLHMWNYDAPTRATFENFTGNLTEIITTLKTLAPDTKFLWVRCTPYTITDKKGNRTIDRETSARLATFNKLSDAVMTEHAIPMVDLWAICEANLNLSSGDGVHWQNASTLFAEAISKEIEKALAGK